MKKSLEYKNVHLQRPESYNLNGFTLTNLY